MDGVLVRVSCLSARRAARGAVLHGALHCTGDQEERLARLVEVVCCELHHRNGDVVRHKVSKRHLAFFRWAGRRAIGWEVVKPAIVARAGDTGTPAFIVGVDVPK